MNINRTSVMRKVLAVSLAAAMLVGTGFTAVGSYIGTSGISASAAYYGDFEYINYDTIWVVDYTGNDSIMTIPSQIIGKPVTHIGGLHGNDNVKSVIIPDAVTSMSAVTFSSCHNLESVVMSDNIESIGRHAFADCSSLKSITLPDSLTFADQSLFVNCVSLKTAKIGNGLTTIPTSTFENCSSLESIALSDRITEINTWAFTNCSSLKSISTPNVKSLGNSVFRGCSSLKNISIPNVTSMGISVFAGCSSLESITVPGTVSDINDWTFENCSNLKSVVLGNGVKSIHYAVFRGCKNLESIVIPESVTYIEGSAFDYYYDTKVTIYGKKGSYAEEYANQHKLPFVSEYSNISYLSEDEIVLGDTVTVNAESYGGNGDCTYAVLYKKKSDTKWTVKQNYSTNKTIAVKPAKATDYDICVKVKDSAGNIVKKFFDVKVNAKLANTSTISATTIKKGDTVTLKGSATGGLGSYTYAVLYKKKSETKWTVRQGYKANDEILVRPYTNTNYDICIKVKDEQGTIAKKYFTVTVQ